MAQKTAEEILEQLGKEQGWIEPPKTTEELLKEARRELFEQKKQFKAEIERLELEKQTLMKAFNKLTKEVEKQEPKQQAAAAPKEEAPDQAAAAPKFGFGK